MANSSDFVDAIRAALALDHPYRFASERERAMTKLGHEQWTQASVLLLLGAPGPSVLLTKRTESVETHKGQMAFPGGTREGNEDEDQAALRETHEEVGLSPARIELLGRLPQLKTPTGFEITPVIGQIRVPHTTVELKVSPAEIADTFWIPLLELTAPGVYREETMERGSLNFKIDVFEVRGQRIWGATGSMLRNFMERLERVGGLK